MRQIIDEKRGEVKKVLLVIKRVGTSKGPEEREDGHVYDGTVIAETRPCAS